MYYRIGLFSKMNRLTIKTLRYYDEMGLLKPAKVDEWTNYRLYDSQNIAQLHRIIGLKQIGFSISEIKEIVAGNPSAEDLAKFLAAKKRKPKNWPRKKN